MSVKIQRRIAGPAIVALLMVVCPSGALAEEPAAQAGAVAGTVTAKLAKQKEGVLVYLSGVAGTYPAPKEHATIDQKDLVFIPHVLPVLVGTTVDFLNSDNVRHNVFTPDGEKFNLGTWPKGEVRSYTFAKPGVYTLLCNVHPEMEAFVVALENPFYTTTGKDGAFRIEHVPPGKYSLRVFAEKLAAEPAEVVVTAGGVASATLALKR